MIFETIPKNFHPKKFQAFDRGITTTSPAGEATSGGGIEFYLGLHVHAEDAAHLGSMIFPDFKIVDDFVFLADAGHPEVAKRNASLNLKEWQSSWNRLALSNLFREPRGEDDLDNELWVSLLEIFKLGWSTALQKSFPERIHRVCTSFEIGYDPCVYFYEEQ